MSRFKVSAEDLNTALGFAKSILADKSVKDDRKQITFTVRDETLLVGATTTKGSVSTRVKTTDLNIDGDNWSFQLRYGVLMNMLGAYANLSLTHIEYIEFEDTGRVLRVMVHEEPNDEENEAYRQDQYYNFDKTIPHQRELDKFHQDPAGEVEPLDMGTFTVYLSCLTPKLANTGGDQASAQIHIAPEFIFVRSTSSFYAFKNELPGVFDHVSLGQTYVDAIRSLMKYAEEQETGIQVGQAGVSLYFECGDVRLFLIPKQVNIDYKALTGPIFEQDSDEKYTNRNLGVVVNRAYFKDTLPRLNVGDSKLVKISFEDNVMHLVTDEFSQEIPLMNGKGDFDKVAFKSSIPLLTNILVDGDALAQFTDIRFYFIQDRQGYMLYAMDGSGTWISAQQVGANG